MVEQPTHELIFKGLNLAPAGTGRKEISKTFLQYFVSLPLGPTQLHLLGDTEIS